jgi:hypothetical protein
MVAARRNERGARHPLHQLETEYPLIEAKCAVEIGNLEMDMPDADAGVDLSRWRGAFMPLVGSCDDFSHARRPAFVRMCFALHVGCTL